MIREKKKETRFLQTVSDAGFLKNTLALRHFRSNLSENESEAAMNFRR